MDLLFSTASGTNNYVTRTAPRGIMPQIAIAQSSTLKPETQVT